MVDKKCGHSVLSGNIPIVDKERIHASRECITQEYIFDTGRPILTDRFCGDFALSFYSGRLFGDLGFMGDSDCAKSLLEGTHVFPEGIGPTTKMPLVECSNCTYPCQERTYAHLSQQRTTHTTGNGSKNAYHHPKADCILNTLLLLLTTRLSQNCMLLTYCRLPEEEFHL